MEYENDSIDFMRWFDHYSSNCTFLGSECIEDFRKRVTSSVFETPYGTIKLSKTAKVIIKDNCQCVECNKPATFVTYQKSNENGQVYITFWIRKKNMYTPLTKDHIVAKTHGGSDAYENLQSLCYICNQDKGDCLMPQTTLSVSKNGPSNRKVITKEDYDLYQKKVKDFKFLRKRVKRFRNLMPWYMRLMGVDKFLERHVISHMKQKGYFIEDDEKKGGS